MEYSYSTTYSSGDPVAALVASLIMLVIMLPFTVLMIVSMWKLFTMAGKPGWASIVPIYNYIVMLEIVGRPMWWLAIILLVPFANIVFAFMLIADFAKVYGKGVGFAVLLILLPIVGFPLLAFSKDTRYLGPIAANGASYGAQPPYPGQAPQQPAQPEQPQPPLQ